MSFEHYANYMKKRTVIKLGFTFDFLAPGFFFIIGGGICLLANLILAIFLILFGILLLLLKTGIEIDISNRKVRKYYDLFSIRFGNWINTAYLKKVKLRATNESQTMNGLGGSKTYRTKTYDIIFFDSTGNLSELNDFINYNIACNIFNIISESFALESENEVEQMRAIGLKRRKERK